jgi:Prokaryotic E2 family E
MSNPGTFIFIENQRHDLSTDEISADEIRHLGNIPADNKIFRETAGDEPDPEIPTSGPFKVHHGEKFYAVPPGVFGAVQMDEECTELIAKYGGRVQSTPDGQRFLILQQYPLGPAWNPPSVPLAIRITGYPEAQLDGFYIPGNVRLTSGSQPTNASLTAVFGPELWWAFSYHPQGWRPGKHNIRSFLGFVQQRFAEGR